jgi:hypothetical protein
MLKEKRVEAMGASEKGGLLGLWRRFEPEVRQQRFKDAGK